MAGAVGAIGSVGGSPVWDHEDKETIILRDDAGEVLLSYKIEETKKNKYGEEVDVLKFAPTILAEFPTKSRSPHRDELVRQLIAGTFRHEASRLAPIVDIAAEFSL